MKVIAETAYNIVQALSPEEEQRFYVMIGVNPSKRGKPNRNNLPPKTVITEQMAQVITSQARRNKEKATRKNEEPK